MTAHGPVVTVRGLCISGHGTQLASITDHPERFVYVRTFGCQMNVHDTNRIYQVLAPYNYAPTTDPARANLILLNTCSVREKAEKKVYAQLGRYVPLKEYNEDLILGVAGCVAQQQGTRLVDTVPQLDLVFGPDNVDKLPALIEQVRASRDKVVETAFTKRTAYRFIEAEPGPDVGVTEFVTVMKGCDKVCTFCIVPFTRGREVSKPPDMIIGEVERLVAAGVREVTLLGQNVNSYGKDKGGKVHFAELLRSVDAIEGLERLRFTTSHPVDLTDELIDCFGELSTLCEYLHLPVQSGSPRVLEAMRRLYTVEHYLDRIARLRARHANMALSTDLIVGFPGETERDFEATLELMKHVCFDSVFAFNYSPRPGTRAARLDDDVPDQIKRERLNTLFELQKEITAAHLGRYEGQTVEVLVEGPSRDAARGAAGEWQLTGRTRTNVIVNVPVSLQDFWSTRWIGQLADVTVGKVKPHSLYGQII